MEIKKSEGQTLLTLLRLAICGVAALCIFGMQGFVNATFDFFRNSEDMVNSFSKERKMKLSRRITETVISFTMKSS